MKGFGNNNQSKKKKIYPLNYKNEDYQILNQAIRYQSEGNIVQAIKCYEFLIRKEFQESVVFANYGIILINLGRLQEAEVSIRKAIELNPKDALLHTNLGGILKDLGEIKQAEVSIRKAIELNPKYANAYLNLGIILSDLGNLHEAAISTRKAIELNPDYAIAHLNLGNILKDLGEIKQAEVSIRKAIELNPDYAIAHLNLGNILSDLGNLQEAAISTRKAIELNPNYAIAHLNLGSILSDLGNLQEAALSTRKAIELNPDSADAYLNLGNIFSDLGKIQQAEVSIRKAIELNPDLADAYFNIFRIYEKINNLEKLKELLHEFNSINCVNNELLIFRARLSFRNKEYKTAKELIDNISSKWIEKNNSVKQIMYWNYKAFIEDKIGNYDNAYYCFEKSQKNSNNDRFDKDSYLNFINSYKKNIINKKTIIHRFNDGIEDSNLSFLIGFPRSGTTLLDTILRSHKDIEVIEEKPLIATIEELLIEKFNGKLDNLCNISENNIIKLREKYFELLKKYKTKDANITIDKLPLHTVSLPLINLLFPNAKIIFTHRHPYDTVLSCFQQSFKPNNAMMNLISLKSSSIIYDQVMDAWDIYKQNLNLNFITSKYEDLIEFFDCHTLKILKFLEVEWDENIKNYRQTAIDRVKIDTPSSSQVVQPLYKSSIEKWKNYEKYFRDCHQFLDKWISYFDY